MRRQTELSLKLLKKWEMCELTDKNLKLQQRRDEHKRRKALHEDMDTFIRDYKATLNGMLDSPSPQELLNVSIKPDK